MGKFQNYPVICIVESACSHLCSYILVENINSNNDYADANGELLSQVTKCQVLF